MVENEIVGEAFKLIDPHHGTNFEKSRTAFISFAPINYQMTISAFTARRIGFLSGDRFCFVQHNTNKLVWLFFKTTQKFRSVEVKIRSAGYSGSSKQFVEEIGKSFDFNNKYKGRIRLYLNIDKPIKHKVSDGEGGMQECEMYQLYDIPELRPDLEGEELAKHIESIKNSNYIIKSLV